MKKILVACAGGVATSTVVKSKLKKALDGAGLAGAYELEQCKVSDAPAKSHTADLLIETTQIVGTFGCPAYSGVPFLTGVGVDKLMAQILSDLNS